MNTALYIARRYFFSGKLRNAINIISAISITGVAVGSMALVIILSVFNGLEAVILSLVNAFNPDIKVSPAKGKVFFMDDLPVEQLEKIPGLAHYSRVIEDNALLRYDDRQHVGIIKGVDSSYLHMSPLDTLLLEGRFRLREGGTDYGLVGQGVAYLLGIRTGRDAAQPLTIFVPRRDARPGSHSYVRAFNQKNIYPSGIFGIQPEIDENYVLVPLEVAQELYDYTHEVSALEIALEDDADQRQVISRLNGLLGPDFIIETRIQQQDTLYRILRSEKWVTFLILILILIIATFNVIGSLSLVILEKRKDITILYSMGADQSLIRKIFLYEGLLITVVGALAGIALGAGIALAQQQFGLVPMGAGTSFIADAYPVQVLATDLMAVFGAVLVIGWATSRFPVQYISRKILSRPEAIKPAE